MRFWIAPVLLALAAPAAAQETRTLPEDYAPPAADLTQMEWLVGHWRGTGIGGHTAVEHWLPATGDTMVGTFIQTDDTGDIRFSEHMYLSEVDGSLELRLKHFNPDMTSWEERDDYVTFRLIEVEHCAARFGGLTLRCDGDDRLLVAVLIRNSEGATGELVFHLERVH
ncbi:DUF6265 family protein [Aurantiacibacter sp. MUD11]|uniref:DUF6265 family protein n=1 Tax=Aurantiacibacter sp. MUD11 TaxID=3003265 RepID=UPI0022AB3CF7|nr:DUF6265 family protein [Aurantiacibacter sp. MUD11]WAT17256.1 DUF6265 family protein [Aurantiacibacter sp. MUD11]